MDGRDGRSVTLSFGVENAGGRCEGLMTPATGIVTEDVPIEVLPRHGAVDGDGFVVLRAGETREVMLVARQLPELENEGLRALVTH